MAWLFVPGLADLSSPLGSWSPITAPSVTWRGKPLPRAGWSRVWQKARWIRRLSGTTFSPSTADAGVDAFIASLPDFRASRGARPGRAPASRTSGGSGPTSSSAFAKFDPTSCSWKTCLPLFPEADWPSFSATWPTSGSMRNGFLSVRPTLEEVTNGSAFSFWPTATDADSRSSARHTTTTGVMHPGTMLTDAVRLWRTPDAPNAGGPRTHTTSKGNGHQFTIAEQAEHWATPSVPNGGRSMPAEDVIAKGATSRGKRQVDLGSQTAHWPTPAARDYKGENGEDHLTNGTGRKHLDQLPNFVAHLWATPRAEDGESCGNHPGANDSLTGQTRMWPTLAATPYGSSQNGINGKGGENERPSANTPSLERMSHSFLPLLQTSTAGDACSPSDPTSRPHSQWKTPHGFANTDQYGRTGGGGGEFHKQVMRASESWATPRANCNVTSEKNVKAFSEGGNTSKPGLAQQAAGSLSTKGKPKLNANFVEWLMGWPIGWTASELAATELSRWQQRMRSSLWQLVQASGGQTPKGTTEGEGSH